MYIWNMLLSVFLFEVDYLVRYLICLCELESSQNHQENLEDSPCKRFRVHLDEKKPEMFAWVINFKLLLEG